MTFLQRGRGTGALAETHSLPLVCSVLGGEAGCDPRFAGDQTAVDGATREGTWAPEEASGRREGDV